MLVVTGAGVEGATSTPEQLIEQLKTTCTAKATEMMMLAAKDPAIAADAAAANDDLTVSPQPPPRARARSSLPQLIARDFPER